MEKETKPDFKFLNVILLESTFKRVENIDFALEQKPTLDINTGLTYSKENANQMACVVEVKYESKIGEVKIIEAFIKMAGTFEKIGTPELDFDKFGKINGPAIIFPFVREHLASLSTKASIHTILLPPVNFIALAKAKEKGK